MTDIDPSSPANLRALMLYDISQRKTMRESIENHRFLCKHLGKKAISYDEYECRFNRCLNEYYHSAIEKRDLPIPDIHVCILSNIINGKSAEKSIDDLCDAFKNHKLDKEDHDYWYKRFDSGHSLSRVTFSDLPDKVFGEIVERCDLNSYFNLRKVSSGLRTVVDQLAPPCTRIDLMCRGDRMRIYIDDAIIANSEYFDKTKSQLPLGVIEKRSLKTLELLLRNPKLRLKDFEFFSYPYAGIGTPPLNYKEHFFNLLNSFDHKIHVEECVMVVDNENELIEVLKCLKPRTLEKLDIDIEFSMDGIDEVVKMDQWKLAKHLKINTCELPPVENFFHFSTFDLGIESIALEEMVKLCDNASKSINFESFTLKTKSDIDTEEVKRVLNLHPTSSRYLYSIPNTNLIVQFSRWNSNWLRICKD